ncbi:MULTISPECIES: ATP-binding protein [unclassified Paenibacillus]|uniref:ATP-binding protein n=1 Tax=unclassified Paenibacillus TaxID=185978 RepID=UPI000956D3D2|nr:MULTISPECIES: ATP-binding protein [unclassified Paenibacillus]ASS67809.2 PAS domain-containing protein [Paenibacillus sp. RUD330]SIR60261.1 Signal transduction histidine kinase [Paenibacillus sp. RU4X]SIR69119.1 Signal transduction histidine kinase [Paenibacillus sp. RU4T]
MELLDFEELKRYYQAIGLDSSVIPDFKDRLAVDALRQRKSDYADVLEVSLDLAERFLGLLPQDPMLVAVSDGEGHVLGFGGNPAMIGSLHEFNIAEGVRYGEEAAISSITLCLERNEPVQVIGAEHYHLPLQQMACYTAPLPDPEGSGRIYATISIMTVADNAHPQLLALLGTMADSIERELLLRKRNTQQQILTQALLETSHFGVVLTDERGTILTLNDSVSRMLSLADKREGLDVRSLPVVGPCFRRLLDEGGDHIVGLELSDKRFSVQKHFILDIVPVVDGDGRLIRTAGTLRETTEMKRAEEQLRHNEKLVFAGQLAVGIAHEIRNPLTAIKGMLQFTSSQLDPAHYSLLMSEIERINLITDDFLVLGRPKTRPLAIRECSGLLEETLQMFEFQCRLENISIRREYISSGLLLCECDQMKQVFLNVLRNASEAMPRGGEISITLEAADGRQTISISDTGAGIDAEGLKRAGEPFHTTKPGGNGLGLMIVKRIMAAHEGSFAIDSIAGEGTVVTLELPLAGSGRQPMLD